LLQIVTIERRLELLKLEGRGFNQVEIVKELSDKFQCSERAVYFDFENRAQWQPKLMQLEGEGNLLMKIMNRNDQIYRMAAFKATVTENDSVYIGALGVMLRANERQAEVAIIPELINRLTTLEEQAKRKLRHERPL